MSNNAAIHNMTLSREWVLKKLKAENRDSEFLVREKALMDAGVEGWEATRITAVEFGYPKTMLGKPTLKVKPGELPGPEKPKRSRGRPKNEESEAKKKTYGSTALPHHVILWIFDHMDGDLPSASSAPSPGAFHLLKHCRSDDDAKRDFYKTIWPKVIPTKMELEELVKKRADDGRQISIIDRLVEIGTGTKPYQDRVSLLRTGAEREPVPPPRLEECTPVKL